MSAEAQLEVYDDSSQIGGDGNQYLTFMLAGEEYGVDILRVQEIKGWDTVTKIPNTPEYIKGVINIRGTIVPIIYLRQRFGLEAKAYGLTTVVIVLRVVCNTPVTALWASSSTRYPMSTTSPMTRKNLLPTSAPRLIPSTSRDWPRSMTKW